MTVVAYSSKFRVMAADSRSSDEHGMHVTQCQKLFWLANGALLGTAGDSDDRDVRELLGKARHNKMPTRAELRELAGVFKGILVFPKSHKVYLVEVARREHQHEGEWSASVDELIEEELPSEIVRKRGRLLAAVGCGAQYAYGAMEVGASPEDAVRATIRRDSACALPVQWEKIP